MAGSARVVVTNRVFADVRARLDALGPVAANDGVEPWSAARVAQEAGAAEALLAFMTDRVDADLLDACPRLRIVACALKGYDNIDVAACAARGVMVSIVPDLLTEPTAELAVALTLAQTRPLITGDARVRAGLQGWRADLYGRGLDGATVGILGLGRVGLATARRLAGFGCSLVGFDLREVDDASRLGIAQGQLETVLATSDVVIVALPLTADTLHLVGRARLAALRPGAHVVNVGRGSVVDEAAVAAALEAGQLGGYAADVFELEDWARSDRPRAIPESLLAQRDRTVFTPHLGSAVRQVRHAIEMRAVDNIEAVLIRGAAPPDEIRAAP